MSFFLVIADMLLHDMVMGRGGKLRSAVVKGFFEYIFPKLILFTLTLELFTSDDSEVFGSRLGGIAKIGKKIISITKEMRIFFIFLTNLFLADKIKN